MTVEATAVGPMDLGGGEVMPAGVLAAISPEFVDTLASLRGRFLDLLEVPAHETMALVIRLSNVARSAVRSRWLPVSGIGSRS